ncbi:MAG: bifunctional DNA-binding transcriptional regulator/O6-methylguanine-DNA methyltransferase Ada, partial [Hyphomicrobiaceae bacterium]
MTRIQKTTPSGKSAAPAPALADDACWTAVLTRDARCDGRFVYAVTTTGIYCRPTCPSRRPLRRNVVFLADAEAARRAGFRACLRCEPDADARHAALSPAVAQACRLMADAEEPPRLSELAQAVGASPSHLHRLFKSALGLTPKDYGEFLRRQRLRNGLPGSRSVTQAVLEAGYATSSRFYAHAQEALGMAPDTFRRGGERTAIAYATGSSSLGYVLVGRTVLGLCAILLGDDESALEADLARRFPRAELVQDGGALAGALGAVIALIEAPGRATDALSLPRDVRGTAFQQQVWTALSRIPAGQTATYAEIARSIGRPSAYRAVALACGANPLAVAVPCHRAVRNDGSLSGYRWGIERKRAL